MANLADFLIGRLENSGIRHIFGVTGSDILDFFVQLNQSKKIDLVNNTDEAGSAFAADGYARMNGIGCCVVTYNVGALKVCNAIAGAFAEHSPVIVISGAPSISEREAKPIHHFTGVYDFQRQVFKNITCAQAVLDNPTTAGFEIDRVFEALRYYKQPIYIELPRDIAKQPVHYDVYTQGTPKAPKTDFNSLEDSLHEVGDWIENAKNPVILAGVEVARYGIGRDLVKFAERHNIPIAATLLSKSVINETLPLYIGVYAGNQSSKVYVKDMVEQSDCLLVLGEVLTESTVGYRQVKSFQKRDMVICTANELKVKTHVYNNIHFNDFCSSLFKLSLTKKQTPDLPLKEAVAAFEPQEVPLKTERLFSYLNSILDEKTVVVADAGDALLGASDLLDVRTHNTFFGPAFYRSMGFAIPVALGAQLANNKKRPIVLVGDGSFQMSLSEISTMLQRKLNPIIIVLNNRGYSTERILLDGDFNDVRNWNYAAVTTMMNDGVGIKAQSEKEFVTAVETALASEKLFVIDCNLGSKDFSPALVRIGDIMAKKIVR